LSFESTTPVKAWVSKYFTQHSFIPKFGIVGAAWATLISYSVTTNFTLIILRKLEKTLFSH